MQQFLLVEDAFDLPHWLHSFDQHLLALAIVLHEVGLELSGSLFGGALGAEAESTLTCFVHRTALRRVQNRIVVSATIVQLGLFFAGLLVIILRLFLIVILVEYVTAAIFKNTGPSVFLRWVIR